jgi:hypothetical protein
MRKQTEQPMAIHMGCWSGPLDLTGGRESVVRLPTRKETILTSLPRGSFVLHKWLYLVRSVEDGGEKGFSLQSRRLTVIGGKERRNNPLGKKGK